MPDDRVQQRLGLGLILQQPDSEQLERIPRSRGRAGEILYPEVDVDGDHIHFEMVPMRGESLLWLTIRRGMTPESASAALRKIADLIDRHGHRVLSLLAGAQGSFSSEGEIVEGPLRLQYDENGDLILPPKDTAADKDRAHTTRR